MHLVYKVENYLSTIFKSGDLLLNFEPTPNENESTAK